MNYGFLPSANFNNPHKLSLSGASNLAGTGAGRTVLLYKYFEKMVGRRTVPRNQGRGSDCVGQAVARAVDVRQGVQIAGLGLPFKWVAPACASTVYAGARVEIGKQKYGMGTRFLGAYVPYATQFVREIGCLYMRKYPSVDLSVHSWARSNEWGSRGVPDELEDEARLHGIETEIPVNSYEEYRDAICNGCPVIIGSNYGFKGQSRKGGYLKPRGTWAHAMVGTGVDDIPSRPGGLIENSWGEDWVNGDEYLDQPPGSFWVDAEVIDAMCRRGEAVAISGHEGFVQQLNYLVL